MRKVDEEGRGPSLLARGQLLLFLVVIVSFILTVCLVSIEVVREDRARKEEAERQRRAEIERTMREGESLEAAGRYCDAQRVYWILSTSTNYTHEAARVAEKRVSRRMDEKAFAGFFYSLFCFLGADVDGSGR
jgi:cell division protein FtsI/penicillin-binding protein 2